MKPVLIVENDSAFELVYRVQKILVRNKNKACQTFTQECLNAKTHADVTEACEKYVNMSKFNNKRNNNYPFKKPDNYSSFDSSYTNENEDNDDNDGDIIK
jgi:hypothetical protein